MAAIQRLAKQAFITFRTKESPTFPSNFEILKNLVSGTLVSRYDSILGLNSSFVAWYPRWLSLRASSHVRKKLDSVEQLHDDVKAKAVFFMCF